MGLSISHSILLFSLSTLPSCPPPAARLSLLRPSTSLQLPFAPGLHSIEFTIALLSLSILGVSPGTAPRSILIKQFLSSFALHPGPPSRPNPVSTLYLRHTAVLPTSISSAPTLLSRSTGHCGTTHNYFLFLVVIFLLPLPLPLPHLLPLLILLGPGCHKLPLSHSRVSPNVANNSNNSDNDPKSTCMFVVSAWARRSFRSYILSPNIITMCS